MESPSERIERELRETFPSETLRLDCAGEAFEAGKAKLYDGQGRQVYGEELHAERMTDLLAQLDTVGAAVTSAAEASITAAETELARLEGADGWQALTAAEQQQAATRQPFIAEDSRDGRPDQLVTLARGALAANDSAALYLWARGIRRRVDATHDNGQRVDPELASVLRDLEERVMGDPAAVREKRQKIERKIESAKVLTGRVSDARRQADGRHERMLSAMRSQYAI